MTADRLTLALLARISAARTDAELADLYGEAIGLDVTFEAWMARRAALDRAIAGPPDLAAEARRHSIALASIALVRRVDAREAASWTFGRDARLGASRPRARS